MKNPERKTTPDIRQNILRRLFQVAFYTVVPAFLLFVSAGTLKWPIVWLYLLLSVAVIAINALIFPPELIAERGKKKENVEEWDQRLTSLLFIPWIGLFVVAGLDLRFGWTTEMPVWTAVLGLAIFILGSALVSWAMVSNQYFSTVVRIQYERGHKVCSSGPYRYVRHPGYLGMIAYQLFSPLIFGSLWAFIPAGLMAALFLLRTAREDRTMKEKLEGYQEYSERVRWRMAPGVW